MYKCLIIHLFWNIHILEKKKIKYPCFGKWTVFSGNHKTKFIGKLSTRLFCILSEIVFFSPDRLFELVDITVTLLMT